MSTDGALFFPIVVTRKIIAEFRNEIDLPIGRLGILFGLSTQLHFEGVDPRGVELFETPEMPKHVLRFTSAESAREIYRDLHPDHEVIFCEK